jgi:succinylglutamate desuccinylase
MLPGFKNFQKIQKAEKLATNVNGSIVSDLDGYILMPLYQHIGEDGFFIVVDDI